MEDVHVMSMFITKFVIYGVFFLFLFSKVSRFIFRVLWKVVIFGIFFKLGQKFVRFMSDRDIGDKVEDVVKGILKK